jgi:hypothetical protein
MGLTVNSEDKYLALLEGDISKLNGELYESPLTLQ